MDNYNESLYENEEDYCPLCCEEMDITDKNFKPCPCGYQICQFCYNNIRTNPELNGKCPACRRDYDDESVEYTKMTAEEFKMYHHKQERKKKEKKEQEKQRREAEVARRHHLANVRVIQKNLVYVLGLNPGVPHEDLPQVLRSERYFGRFGKINKVVINRRGATTGSTPAPPVGASAGTGYSVYVTFARKEDAARCIEVLDGSVLDDRVLKAAHGTTKYCSSYLRGQACQNPNCMFLHEPGEEADSYSRERGRQEYGDQSAQSAPITQSAHSVQNVQSAIPHGHSHAQNARAPALPSTVSWAAAGSASVTQSSSQTANIDAFPTLGTQQRSPPSATAATTATHAPSGAGSVSADAPRARRGGEKKHLLNDTMGAYKGLSERLKAMNGGAPLNYRVRASCATPQSWHMFHPLDVRTLETAPQPDRARVYKLVEALLYGSSSKNYNYRACLEPRQAPQVAVPPQVPQHVPQHVPQQAPAAPVGGKTAVPAPQTPAGPAGAGAPLTAFLQQRLQQQKLDPQPARANTQALLSQLLK